MATNKPKTKENKGGRPTSFKPEYIEQAYKLSLLGAKDTEMADFFGVSEVTLNAWKKEFPEFLKSLKDGKIKADLEISQSLYKRALGYTITLESENVTEEAIAPTSLDEKGKPKSKINEAQQDFEEFKTLTDAKTVKYKHTKNVQQQHYAPDVTAQIFWLKNRQPDKWREKQENKGDDLPPPNITIQF